MKNMTVTMIPLPEQWEVIVRCESPKYELSTIVDSDQDAARFVARCVADIRDPVGRRHRRPVCACLVG